MAASKKHTSVRARANKAATASTLDHPTRLIPKMPDGVDWHTQAVQWWSDVWSSPMSPEWDISDIHNVTICAMLINDIWTAGTAKDRKDAMAEYRLQRKDLGLSPYDRRRLEWTIETAEDAKDKGKSRAERFGAEQPKAGEDPRLALVQ